MAQTNPQNGKGLLSFDVSFFIEIAFNMLVLQRIITALSRKTICRS